MQGRIVRSVLEHLSTQLNHARYINPDRPTLGRHWSGPDFLDPYVWRASRNQDKDEIFTNGFRPRGTHKHLATHVQGTPGDYISFGKSEMAAISFMGWNGWMTVSNHPAIAVNVPLTYQAEHLPSFAGEETNFAQREAEFAGIGPMPAQDILYARQCKTLAATGGLPYSYHGNLWENPDYVPRNYTIHIASEDPQEAEKLEADMKNRGDLSPQERLFTFEEAQELHQALQDLCRNVTIRPKAPMLQYGTVLQDQSITSAINQILKNHKKVLLQTDHTELLRQTTVPVSHPFTQAAAKATTQAVTTLKTDQETSQEQKKENTQEKNKQPQPSTDTTAESNSEVHPNSTRKP